MIYLFLILQGVASACHLSHYPAHSEKTSIPNFQKVNENLYRGARPRKQGIKELKRLKIKTIVNLERETFKQVPGEVKKERQWAKKAGIKFLHVPMHPFFAPNIEDIDKALRYITDPENQPVFVNCDQGNDRTGIVIAAYRIKVNGWSIEESYEEMKKYGYHNILLFWWKDVLLAIKEKRRIF